MKSRLVGYRTLRALDPLDFRHPGVSLRSTPGFMLTPATRVFSMKTAKEQAIDSISRLPAVVTWQDIVYCLRVRRKIEEGIKAAEDGRILSHDEVKRLFAR